MVSQFSSVQSLSHVLCTALWPYALQHARPPHLSQTPGVHSNSCPLSRWCHPTISSSAVPFSSCLQSCPTWGSFVMSQFFASGGQSTGWSFSFSISPSNEYSGLISFRMDWLDLLAVQGTLKSFLQHHSSKASILQHSVFLMVQLSVKKKKSTITGNYTKTNEKNKPTSLSDSQGPEEWKSFPVASDLIFRNSFDHLGFSSIQGHDSKHILLLYYKNGDRSSVQV